MMGRFVGNKIVGEHGGCAQAVVEGFTLSAIVSLRTSSFHKLMRNIMS